MRNVAIKNINDIIADNDGMWVTSDDFPCLFRYNYLEQELELVAMFPETVNMYAAFSRMIKLENEIYFIPWFEKNIYYYDIISHKFHKLDIPFKNFCTERKAEAVVYEKNIYCINRFPDVIIKINSISKEVNIFYVDMKLYADRLLPCDEWTIYPGPCVYQEKILWTNYKNVLTIFDIKNEKISITDMKGLLCEKPERSACVKQDYMIGVRALRDMLWFFTFEGRVYRYDKALHKIYNKSFDNYVYFDDADNIIVCFLYDLVLLNDELIFIPSYKNKCIKCKGSSMDQFEEALDDYSQNWRGNRRNYTICKVINDQKILLYSYYENIFYILDPKKNNVCEWIIKDSLIKLAEGSPRFKQVVTRHQVYGFDDLDWLIQSVFLDEGKDKKQLASSVIGERIYRCI